jgi:hypothetical protein
VRTKILLFNQHATVHTYSDEQRSLQAQLRRLQTTAEADARDAIAASDAALAELKSAHE